MADYFFESSALIKRYKSEPGTDVVNGLFTPSNRLLYLNLAAFEVRKVFYRLYLHPLNQDQRISEEEFDRLQNVFNQDLRVMLRVDLNQSILDKMDIILQSTWLKSIFDLVQLCAFLEVREQYPTLIFTCSDVRSNLISAAKSLVTDRFVLVPEILT